MVREGLLDTLRDHEIPEGVRLELRLAGPVVRACAWLIDASIRLLLYLAVTLLLSFLGGLGFGLMLIGFFLIEWFYPVYFEIRSGATPGKRMMGIAVIRENGTPVDFYSSGIRNLLRAVDFMPFMYALGLVSMLLDRDFRRLGDLAAGTLVIYADRPQQAIHLDQVTPVQPPVSLDLKEQSAVLAFMERSHALSASRRVELAEILGGITGHSGVNALERLWGYASWINKGD